MYLYIYFYYINNKKQNTNNNIIFIWAKVTNSGLSHQWEFVLMFGSLCFRLVVSSFWLSCLHSVSLLLKKRSCWDGGNKCVHRLMEWTEWLVAERRHFKCNPFIEFVRLSYSNNLLLLAENSTQAVVILIALKPSYSTLFRFHLIIGKWETHKLLKKPICCNFNKPVTGFPLKLPEDVSSNTAEYTNESFFSGVSQDMLSCWIERKLWLFEAFGAFHGTTLH